MKKILCYFISISLILCILPYSKASAVATLDKYYKYQWALHNDGTFDTKSAKCNVSTAVAGIDINIEEAWNTYDGGRHTIIAVIDTGVDYSNSDLSGHLWTNKNEIAGNGIDDDINGFVDDVNGWNFRDNNNQLYTVGQDHHGTHCFGTIAAQCDTNGIAGICGTTNNIEVMVLKVFDGSTSLGNSNDIINAIKYAENNGASIVNLSLGLNDYCQALYDTIKNSNMLFVTAAGNSGNNSDIYPIYPAAFDLDNIISVANIECDGTLSSSSNFGKNTVDLGAPGSSILGYGSESKYYYMTGTSMAAPMVTGVAALVYSYLTDATIYDVKNIIMETVTPLPSLDGYTLSGGMLNAGAAINYASKNVSVSAKTFPDVSSSSWYYKYVTDLATKGIVNGYSDGTFRPENSVTFGESLTLIMLACGFEKQTPTGLHWASGYLSLAEELGIVDHGYISDLNLPADRLFIARTSAKALNLEPNYTSASPFYDVGDPYLSSLFYTGIVNGSFDSDGNRVFKPNDNIKRSEICTIIYNISNYL